jgi:DNA-directed RNA polymerase specialized sigma24 family protein
MDTFSQDEASDLPEKPSLMDEEYCRRIRPKLYYLILGTYGDAVDADDIVQQTIADALGNPKHLQEARSEEAYLLTMARNNANRSRKRKPGKEEAERIFEHRRTNDLGFKPYEGWQL